MSSLRLRHGLLLGALAASAIGCDSSSDGVVELRVTGPDDALGPAAVLMIGLYGYDLYESDIEATPILEQNVRLARLPSTVELVVPDEPHTLIVQGTPVDREDAGYSFYIDVDLDGDGRICQGELVQVDSEASYEASIPAVIDVALVPRTQDVPCGAP
jgi:hypothetical protein